MSIFNQNKCKMDIDIELNSSMDLQIALFANSQQIIKIKEVGCQLKCWSGELTWNDPYARYSNEFNQEDQTGLQVNYIYFPKFSL